MSKLNPQDWDNFWQRATVTSLEGNFQGNYNFEILDFWEAQLAHGPGHVVDLATGNGALVWIVDELLNGDGNHCRVTGVDLASVSPFETLGKEPEDFPMVEFINSTSIEALPFEDGSVDMIISQWGLEYSNLGKTIPEAARVLKPEARMAFICHYEDSSILKDAVMKVEKFTMLLDEEEIFDRYLELDALYNAHPSMEAVKADPRYTKIIGPLNRSLYGIRHYIHNSKDPSINMVPKSLNTVAAMFAPRSPLHQPGRAQTIHRTKGEVLATVARINDLRSAALSYDQCDELEALMTEAGFEVVESKPILHCVLGDVGMAFTAVRTEQA